MSNYHDALAQSFLVGHRPDELMDQFLVSFTKMSKAVADGDQKAALAAQYQVALLRNEMLKRMGAQSDRTSDSVEELRHVIKEFR